MPRLNPRQLAVLRSIAEGPRPGAMANAHRVSASALRARGLVRISGHGPSWHAQLTDAGRLLLRQLSGRETGSSPVPPGVVSRAGKAERKQGCGDPGDQQRLKTQELVAAVIAAGGALTLPNETEAGGVNWRQRAYAAQRHGKVPSGKHLSVALTGAGFEISLLDGDTGNELGADVVPVPARVRLYHPAVQRFRDRPSLHQVSRKALPRALRIMHGLATELDRRGHAIKCADADVRDQGYPGDARKERDRANFTAALNGHEFGLRLTEKGVGLRRPWEGHKERRERSRRELRFDRWDVGRIEPYDKGATGRLKLSILTYGRRQTSWGDRKRWTLEDRLPQVLRELETLAEEAEQRRIEREQQQLERQRAWEAAMATAKDRAIEHHHVETLNRRVDAWNHADDIRAYCDAIEERHRDSIQDDSDSQRWLRFARDYADRLQRRPRMPEDPQLTHEDLKPFLGGWSPYGPERRGW